MSGTLLLLALLLVKHWYVDFVLQTDAMVRGKGLYGNPHGLWHSGQHGLATLAIACFFFEPISAIVVATFDFVTHYHVDYIKMRYGNRDISTSQFWAQLGADQLAHQICYLLIAALY